MFITFENFLLIHTLIGIVLFIAISRKGDNQVIVVCQYKVYNYCELVHLNLLSGFSIDL